MSTNDFPRTFRQLLDRWTTYGDHLRQMGAGPAAEAVDQCRRDLEGFVAENRERLVPVPEAAELTGYSASYLYKLIRSDRLRAERADTGGLRVRLMDLPRRPVPPGSEPDGEDPRPDTRTHLSALDSTL